MFKRILAKVKMNPPLKEELAAFKHAQHNQQSHGNWARGGGGGGIDSLVARSYGEAGAETLAEDYLLNRKNWDRMVRGYGEDRILNVDKKSVLEAVGKKPGMDAFFESINEEPNAQDAITRLLNVSDAMEEIANSEGIYETIPDPQKLYDWAFDKYEDI